MQSTIPPGLPPERPATLRFGKYLLERRIAVGGSSEVFLARPAKGIIPAPRLVIKRLIPAVLEEPGSLGTFAMEARLHRAAVHPNVVEVFEAGSVDGEPYLAMEYVDGVDLQHLMRRAQTEHRTLPSRVALYIAGELCSALSCVHCAVDDTGRPLAVVHRDVTPSNVYLNRNGDVKLGDFGIARMLSRSSTTADTNSLKGKYCYLSPEQVSGEDFDHRADLFSLAVMLSEMLINESLFPGSGQLAVLLAIRDCRIEKLRARASTLPPGLMRVLEKALARDPNHRFPTAQAFQQDLDPISMFDLAQVKQELGRLVDGMCDPNAGGEIITVRGPKDSDEPPIPSSRLRALGFDSSADTPALSIRTRDGRVLGPYPFSKLVELAATSRLDPDDEVELGMGFRRVADTPELERHLPPRTLTTSRLQGPGIPDYVADLSQTSMLEVCARMLNLRETGVLFAEREGNTAGFSRKEIYLAQSRVVHVASSEASELLGEYLVRRSILARSELEIALAVMPRFGGKLGDTLIGLDLVDAVQIFRAIRDQGRDRIADIFRWNSGHVSFYRGVAPHRVEFPLDLDLAPLMLAGMERAVTDEQASLAHKLLLEDLLTAEMEVPDTMKLAAWPPEILKVVGAAGEGRTERDIVTTLAAARLINIPSAFRAIDVACAAGLLTRSPSSRR